MGTLDSWSQGSSANPAATRQSLAETLMGVGTGNNSGGSGVGVSGANSALDLSEFPALGSPRPDAFPPLSAQIQARSEQFKAALAGHISGFPANTGAPLPRMTMEEFPALPGMTLDSQRSNLASHSHTSMGNSNGSIGHIGAAGVSADGSSGHAAAAFSGASNGGSSAHPLSSLVSLNASSATGLGGQSLGGDSSSTTALPGLGRPSTDFPRKNTNSFTELKGGPADHNLSSPLTGNGASGTAVAAAAAAAAVAAVASSSHEPPTSSSNSMQGTGASDLMNGNSGSPNTATQGDGHGLLGLLNTLKTTNHDQSALAFGLDVSKFGLNLSSPGLLYATFTTPWIDQSQANLSHIKPEFSLPSCYQVQPRRPAAERLDRFTEETLFYVFYTMPRDELQVKAAQVLFQRGWRYHKELKLWLTKDPTMGDRAAVVKTPQGEQGIYIFFDPSTWQKVRKEHVLMYDALEDRPALASAVTSSASLSNAPASAAGGAGHLGQQLDPSPLSGAASSASTLSQQNLLAQLQQANLPSHGAGGGLYDSHQTSQTPSSLGLHASSLAHAPGSQLGG
ncbi:transcriptional regulator, partial [Dimargaris verticillata]